MEYGDDAMGLELGMLGKAGSGQLRVTKKEMKLTKKQKLLEEKQREKQHKHSIANGLSSVAFTPVAGMSIELVDPSAAAAQQRVREANQKYFGTQSTFRNVS